jgi:hypothetical protein
LVVERHDLTPPVDVEALLAAQVQLRRVDWPHEDVDAILTGLGQGRSPVTVFVRATDNLLRERFTMAHEFAHLMLPWHLPAPTCHVDEAVLDLQSASTEQQADIFASCLLVPDRWLEQLWRAHPGDMTRTLQELNGAEVTTAAALQAMRRLLLPGWVFVAYGGDSLVVSRGTQLDVSRTPSAAHLEAHAQEVGEAMLNGHLVRWYRLSASASLPVKGFDDVRSDHEILMTAISEVEPDERRRLSMAASANGKVGGTLREAAGRPAAETYEAMLHRLSDWEYSGLLDSPDFQLWLAQRSRAIELGDTKRRRR